MMQGGAVLKFKGRPDLCLSSSFFSFFSLFIIRKIRVKWLKYQTKRAIDFKQKGECL